MTLQAPTATASTPAASALAEFRALRVEVVGFDEAAVMSGLQLRLPRLEIDRFDAAPPQASPHAYVRFTREAQLAGRLRIITSEGRAYERTFVVEAGEEVRTAASTAANLLLSIEQGTVVPDQEDIAIPDARPAEPSASVPGPAASVPEPTPIEASRPLPPPPPPVQPALDGQRRGWELGTELLGIGVLALGRSPYGGPFTAAGGGIGLQARAPRGAVLALEVRGLGRGASTFAVARLRIGLAGGFVWRRRRFELPLLLGASIEPWWAVQSGTTAPIYSGDDVATRPLLFGGYVRVTPALRLAVPRAPLATVRIGPRIELAGSVAAGQQAHVVGLADVTGQPQARVGGFEVALGLEVAFQWSLAGP